MEVLAHLWTGAPPPAEYVDLILCRDVYGIAPSVLDMQDAERVQRHLECISAEAQVRQMRTKSKRRAT